MVKLSDYVIQCIASLGVRHIFLVPGGGAMHLNHSLSQCKEIEAVCCVHEQAAAIAAENYAKASGGLGVCMVTSGPGGTNAITGVAGAYLDSTPMLILSGNVKRADMKTPGMRQKGPQELGIVEIVRTITKHAEIVFNPQIMPSILEYAVGEAMRPRMGPVWLDLPLDVQAWEVEE